MKGCKLRILISFTDQNSKHKTTNHPLLIYQVVYYSPIKRKRLNNKHYLVIENGKKYLWKI